MTMIDPRPKPADLEELHHQEVVRGALAGIDTELREALFAQPGIEELLREGRWTAAKALLKERKLPGLVLRLDLVTPFGLS